MKKSFDAAEIADMYNKFGKKYHETRKQGRFYNEYLEMPASLKLLPDIKNKTVLDAGCGSGIYAKTLAALGGNVIGVDISQTMIDIANEEKLPTDKIQYRVGNLENLDWVEDNSMDVIICNYVLENLHDIQPIFKGFFRILRVRGECLFSISHPIRACSQRTKEGDAEVWQLENYYDHSIRIADFGDGLKVKKYKRTIGDYVNAAVGCGFVVTEFSEPQPVEAGKAVDPLAYDLAMRLPQLLLLKLRKD